MITETGTARRKLEIRGAFIYFILFMLISFNALVFQILSKIKFTNCIFSIIFFLIKFEFEIKKIKLEFKYLTK